MNDQRGREKYTYGSEGREIWLETAEPVRNFDNMLYNKSYFMMIDQCGNGNAKHMVDPGYINNVVADERILYVRDDQTGEYFSVGFGPVYKEYESYRCTSGLNYQVIENVTDGLKVTWRIFVPAGADPVEIWDIRVENMGSGKRQVSLISSVEMNCDGVDTYGGPMFRYANYYPESNAIFIKADAEKFTEIDFPLHNGFITTDRRCDFWQGNKRKFVGQRRSLRNPIEVERGELGCDCASMWTPTGGFQFRFELKSGENADTRFLLGACDRLAKVGEFREKYIDGSLDGCRVFDALRQARAEVMRNIEVETPDDSINRMLNVWGKQQSHYLATWCRWGYKGYRDIVQMSQGVLYWDVDLARTNLLQALGHQYSDGFALRGWNPLDPMRYVDCASWLIPAISEYVKETGDFDFLDTEVEYLDQGQASVYEHLMQTMQRLHTDRGADGMCLTFFGDWNDSLTGLCRDDRGQSVWMSMAFCRCALIMEELAGYLGRKKDVELMRRWHKQMAEAINEHGWDGRWYLRARDDEGAPIGSAKNEEGKIFLNTQSWASLGGICSDERWEQCIEAVDKYLESGWGTILNWPCYKKPVANVGRLSYLRPGICENGSVYTHGAAFLYLAFLERGMADRALKLWRDIHPGNPNRPVACQPNVFANGFDGPETDILPGMAQHMWTTGSASWLIGCTIENMLGLRRGYDGIRIKPCLPSEWDKVRIRRTYRRTTYDVTLTKPAGKECTVVKRIKVDGTDHPVDEVLPIDGREHNVEVEVDSQ